jgi:aldose 1-epimerase
MPVYPSGRQFQIAHGEQRATVVEVGGGLREYFVAGRPVLDPYPIDAICDGAHGAALIPWPNRLGDGRYSFVGQDYQVALTEPERGNAIHGLLRWRNWQAIEHAANRVVMAIRLHPSSGWPFGLDLEIGYWLADPGLTVETRARNIGAGACPYACGQHPYLSPGTDAEVDGCRLELRAETLIVTDSERQLPTGHRPVAGSDLDFTGSAQIGAAVIDSAFTDLERDGEGRAWARLGCPDGRTVSLWADAAYSVLQVFTADTLAPPRRRRGLAVEPMTAAANALQTQDPAVVRLEPGETHVARWGVGLS